MSTLRFVAHVYEGPYNAHKLGDGPEEFLGSVLTKDKSTLHAYQKLRDEMKSKKGDKAA